MKRKITKLPKFVKIFHRIAEITTIEYKSDYEATNIRQSGTSYAVEGKIAISLTGDDYYILDILMHELIHFGLDNMALSDYSSDERLVTALSTLVCSIFLNNPEVLDLFRRLEIEKRLLEETKKPNVPKLQ